MNVEQTLLLVQPSNDYAHRVRQYVPDAVILATPQRATQLQDHPHVISADLDCLEDALKGVQIFAQTHAFAYNGITTFICEAMWVTAYLANRLGLSFYSKDTVEKTRNKNLTYAAWHAAGVCAPQTCQIYTFDDLKAFADQISGPWILKPCDRSGSEWVLRVDDLSDLWDAHVKISSGLAEDTGQSAYLAQEFVTGREFSADLCVENGQVRILRLTEKYLLPHGELAGLVGAYYPACIDDIVPVQNTFEKGVQALGILQGIVMVDAILSNGQIYLLEMALRPGGDCLPSLYHYATGYDPIKATCEIVQGISPVVLSSLYPASVAGLHLMSNQSGHIAHIDFTRLTAHPAVLHVEPYCEVGDTVRYWAGSYDDRILASCIAQCTEPEHLSTLIEELTDCIDVVIEPVLDSVFEEAYDT